MDLITTAEVAALLGVPSDTALTRHVTAVQEDFRRGTLQSFERKEYTVYAEGFGPRVNYVFLPVAPIHQLLEVRIDCTGRFPETSVVTDLTEFTFDSLQHDFRLHRISDGWFPIGRRTVMARVVAGYHPASNTAAPASEPRVPEDLRDGLIEEVIARYRRGTSEQFIAESISGVDSVTRGKLGTTPQFDRMVRRYRRVV